MHKLLFLCFLCSPMYWSLKRNWLTGTWGLNAGALGLVAPQAPNGWAVYYVASPPRYSLSRTRGAVWATLGVAGCDASTWGERRETNGTIGRPIHNKKTMDSNS